MGPINWVKNNGKELKGIPFFLGNLRKVENKGKKALGE